MKGQDQTLICPRSSKITLSFFFNPKLIHGRIYSMHQPKLDSIDFAVRLVECFQSHLDDSPSESLTEDLEAIKTFAALPELKTAMEAATRLRLNVMDIHPFAARMITSALDELGL